MPRRGSRYLAGRASNPLAARFREIERAIRRRQGLGGSAQAGQGGIAPPSGSVTIDPSGSVVTEQSFGQLADPGSSLDYSAGDHTHGTPPHPGGAAESWDAIVDITFAATNEGKREFIGIGEALAYLDSLGFTRAYVLVRPGAYTETANWASPEWVYLQGIPDDVVLTGFGKPQWNHGGFTSSTALEGLVLRDMEVVFGAKATGFTSTASTADLFFFKDCYFDCAALTGGAPFLTNAVNAFYDSCYQRKMATLGQRVYVRNHQVEQWVAGSHIVATVSLIGDIDHGIEQGGGTWTYELPSSGIVDLVVSSSGFLAYHGGGGTGNVTWTLAGSAGEVRLHSLTSADTLTITGAHTTLYISGEWQGATVPAPAAGRISHIDITNTSGSTDVTGPTDLTVGVGGTSTVTLRGRHGTANLVASTSARSSGTLLTGVNIDGWDIDVSHDGTGVSGTAQPYALDASSTDNRLFVPNLDAWPVAGTDAGTNNRIETTPGPAGGPAPANADYLVGTAHAGLSAEIVVGTTPGGELGNTWAAPTVDAVHSGSQHADFQLLSGKDAASGYVGLDASENATIDGTLTVGDKVFPGTDAGATQAVAGLYAGTGAPNNANGNNGDFYFNAAGGVLTTIYHKRLGAWVGVV